MSMATLQSDIGNSRGTVSQVEFIFSKHAEDIMNNYNLEINGLLIELTEIEFYYYETGKHEDIYTHCHNLQKDANNFLYVHPKGCKRGGIDIIFGNGTFYGGILIRGIKVNNQFIAGPANVKNKIIELLGLPACIPYQDLQNFLISLKNNIGCQKQASAVQYKICCAPRFGLMAINDTTLTQMFFKALYRFAREDYFKARNDRSIFKGTLPRIMSFQKCSSIQSLNQTTLVQATNLRDSIFKNLSSEEKETFEASLDPKKFEKSLYNMNIENLEYWVYVHHDIVVGFIGLYREINDAPNKVWLGWFGVDKQYRNRKIGSELLEFVIEKAKQKKYTELHLYTSNQYKNATSLYQKSGFIQYSSKKNYLFYKKII